MDASPASNEPASQESVSKQAVAFGHRLQYALYRATMAPLRSIPVSLARRIGRGAGHLFRFIDRRRYRLALDNLARAFPERSPDERARIARECFALFGASLFDATVSIERDPEDIAPRFDVEGWEHIEALEARGTGYVVMSAHWGAWETLARYLGHAIGELHIISRPPNNPLLARDLRDIRRRYGHVLIDKRRAGHRMLRLLKTGGRVGILIDQRVRPKDGILETFLGELAWTSPLLAFLTRYTGAPVVPVYCKLTDGGRYHVRVEPPIEPDLEGPDAEARLTRAYLASVERLVRAEPERWMWMHRRWQRTAAVRGTKDVERYRGRSRLPPRPATPWRWGKTVEAEAEAWATQAPLEVGDHLLIGGPHGAGKTRLATAIGHRLIDAGHEVRYVTARKLSAQLAKQVAQAGRSDLHRRYEVPTLVIVDDVEAVEGNPEEAARLRDFVTRRRHRRSTLLVSNGTPENWTEWVPPEAGSVLTLPAPRTAAATARLEPGFAQSRQRR